MEKQNGVEAARIQRLRPSHGPTRASERRRMLFGYDSIIVLTPSASVEASSKTIMGSSGDNTARVRARHLLRESGRFRVTIIMVTRRGSIEPSAVIISQGPGNYSCAQYVGTKCTATVGRSRAIPGAAVGLCSSSVGLMMCCRWDSIPKEKLTRLSPIKTSL